MRFFIRLAYNGGKYCGWQSQENSPTVQDELERALSVFFRRSISVTGAGRTDTGVHAREYYAHFDLDVSEDDAIIFTKVVHGLNGILPADIKAFELRKVVDTAHARFDAVSRTYHYYINRTPDPFLNGFSWYYPVELNIDEMNKASSLLPEVKDFTSFSKTGSYTGTNFCKVFSAYWEDEKGLLVFKITADRFLRNMVRAIVGTLVDVGRNKISTDDFYNIIQSRSRSKAGTSVPACGLFLEKIKYPENIFIL